MDLDHALEIADESLAGGYNSMHDQALHFLAAEVRRRASPASVPELREQVEKLTKERDEYKSGFEAAASKYRNLKSQMQEIINVC